MNYIGAPAYPFLLSLFLFLSPKRETRKRYVAPYRIERFSAMLNLTELATYAFLTLGNLMFVRAFAVKGTLPKAWCSSASRTDR